MPCDSQYKDAVTQTFEQIDVLRRLFDKYHEDLQFVTTANGVYHMEMHVFEKIRHTGAWCDIWYYLVGRFCHL